MSFAFNPEEEGMITKEGSDPKWILLSSTWFILNVKVQGYTNKWIAWDICEFWSMDISPCLEDVLRYVVCAIFVIVERKEVLSLRNTALKMLWKIKKWYYRAQNPKDGKESKYGPSWYYLHMAPGYLVEKPLLDISHHKLDRFTDWMEWIGQINCCQDDWPTEMFLLLFFHFYLSDFV